MIIPPQSIKNISESFGDDDYFRDSNYDLAFLIGLIVFVIGLLGLLIYINFFQ